MKNGSENILERARDAAHKVADLKRSLVAGFYPSKKSPPEGTPSGETAPKAHLLGEATPKVPPPFPIITPHGYNVSLSKIDLEKPRRQDFIRDRTLGKKYRRLSSAEKVELRLDALCAELDALQASDISDFEAQQDLILRRMAPWLEDLENILRFNIR